MSIDIIPLFDRLSEIWEKTSGLLLSIFIVFLLYFSFLKFFDLYSLISWQWLFLVAPIALAAVICSIWLWKTNRFFIPWGNKTIAGVSIIVDTDRDRQIITKIMRKVSERINSHDSLGSFKIKMLPSNFLTNDKKAIRYHKQFNFLYDLVIRIFIDSGHYNSIEKIIVSKLSVTFNPRTKGPKKKIYFNTVNLVKDMNIQVAVRDWDFLHDNDGIDKKKYLGNIYHIILYYLGFYSIYLDRHENALAAMLPIFDRRKTQIKMAKTGKDKINFQLTPYNIAEGRLAAILTDLFFYAAIKSYNEKDTEKALANFIKLEKVIGRHPNSFDQFVSMARFSYELGDIDKAKQYSAKAQKIKPKSIEIFLNQGFFAVLDDSPAEFCSAYRSIFKNRAMTHNISWLDVLDFQEEQKVKLNDRTEYLEFSTALIELVFIQSINLSKFRSIINNIPNHDKYSCFRMLGEEIVKEVRRMTIGKTTRSRIRTNKKRKKRKRK